MRIANLFMPSLLLGVVGALGLGGPAMAQSPQDQERNPSLYPQPSPYTPHLYDPYLPPVGTPPDVRAPHVGACRPVPTYEMTGLGLRPSPPRCADRPGEGLLRDLHPGSHIEPMMIIEVGPGTTILIPQRHYFPGMGRVIRVY